MNVKNRKKITKETISEHNASVNELLFHIMKNECARVMTAAP